MSPVVWDVNRVLFKLGPLEFRWYGMLFGLGFLIGYFIMQWMFHEEDKPADEVEWVLIYALIGTTVGARLGHCLFYNPSYYLSNPIKILKIWEGGLASHGAAIGIFTAFWLYARRRKVSYLWIMDRMAIVTALAGCFIRLGNLFNSEILGLPTKGSWGFIFKKVDNVVRHPVQLYESITYLAIFIFLVWVYRKRKGQTPYGMIIGLFMMLVFGSRFFLEYLKTRQAHFGQGMALSMGQWLSIPSVLFGLWMFQISRKNGPPEIAPKAKEKPAKSKSSSGGKSNSGGSSRKKKRKKKK